jgi:RNA polymerase sigma-70 factor (ECF subfamily)
LVSERPAEPRPPTTDGDLLVRLERRDESALEALYDRHAPYVNGIALRILEESAEAEEVTQDVFWQLWKGRIRYDAARGRFTTWLFALTRNRCVDRLRSRKRRPATEPLAAEPRERAPEDPEIDARAGEERARVARALASLPDEQRRAIELCFYEGLTHREAAERLREPLGTIKGRVRMAMEKLKVSLGMSETAL